MAHKTLLFNHILESWTYPTAIDRTTATGLVVGDIGRIAYQSDTGQYWRLTNSSPVTWQTLAANVAYASGQTGLLNVAGTTSTTGVMLGLPGSITPVLSGKALIIISGLISNSSASGGASARMHYGTGAAPINGAAPTGTAIGAIVSGGFEAANLATNFSVSGVVTGLALGTLVWIDMTLAAVSTGTALLTNVAISAIEIP